MSKNLIWGIVVVLVVGLLAVKMLSPSGTSKSGSQTAPSATAEKLTIVGSDTMVELVGKWAEAYMKQDSSVAISVTGGGSGPGVRALIDGATQICAASRSMKDEEKAEAGAKGFSPVEHTVALDGIAVVVNPANPISELTMAQLKSLFTGAVTDWKQLKGAAGKVDILSRENSSGTYQFFQEHVLNKEDYTASAKALPATSAIIETVASDVSAIGYAGLGYVANAKDKVKVIKVKKDDASAAVTPAEATVRDASYPIARALFFYTRGEASGAAKKFIDFCLSPQGQQIAEEAGFVQVAK